MDGTAAIVGGGIGGLATAIALGQHGWQVSVFEREAGPSGAGTALGMWPAALRALDTLGVGDDVRKLGQRQSAGAFQRPDGSRIGVIDTAKLERRTGDPVYLLSRPALLTVLRAAVNEKALHFGAPVDSVAPLSERFDVVVAADGIFSRVRTELFGDTYRARYAGSTAWRGWIDNLPTDTFTETWGSGAKFGVTPQEGGRTNWYATTVATEGAFGTGAELPALRTLFGAWTDPVRTVLDAIDERDILRHDLYVTPRLPTYVRDNVALIGDAAHGMTPDLGRGACEALIDAVTLAGCLRDGATVADSLHAYDRRRRRATQRLAMLSSAANRLTRLQPRWLRDALLRASLRGGPPA